MCLFYVCVLSCWNKICICVYVDSTIIDYSAPDRGAEYWDERVYDSVYGVIIMTKVIARVHPVHYVQVTRFKCVCLSVCPYVCLSAIISVLRNYTSDLDQILCVCYPWPWLGPPPAAYWYVTYFRCCGWRHICTVVILTAFGWRCESADARWRSI